MGRTQYRFVGTYTSNIRCGECDKQVYSTPKGARAMMKLHMKVAHGIINSESNISRTKLDMSSNKNNPRFITEVV